MKKIFILFIFCISLTGCLSTLNTEIDYEVIELDMDNDGNSDYHYTNIYYNDVKYSDLMNIDLCCILNEEDIMLLKQINFPFSMYSYVFSNAINNPEYLFTTRTDRVGVISYDIYFREDVDLEEEVFVYKNVEVKLFNEFHKASDEFNSYIYSLEEREFVSLYFNNSHVDFKMKNYPNIIYQADYFVLYEGNYYAMNCGMYYKLSDEFINLCEENALIFM